MTVYRLSYRLSGCWVFWVDSVGVGIIMFTMNVCPICLKKLKLAVAHRKLHIAYCGDDNAAWRYIGADCYKHVVKAGSNGYKQAGDIGPLWYPKEYMALSAIAKRESNE